jgi:hypothetical protein
MRCATRLGCSIRGPFGLAGRVLYSSSSSVVSPTSRPPARAARTPRPPGSAPRRRTTGSARWRARARGVVVNRSTRRIGDRDADMMESLHPLRGRWAARRALGHAQTRICPPSTMYICPVMVRLGRGQVHQERRQLGGEAAARSGCWWRTPAWDSHRRAGRCVGCPRSARPMGVSTNAGHRDAVLVSPRARLRDGSVPNNTQ